MVRALSVVPGNEERDRQGPLLVAREVVAVGALALDRADEALGPTVGPRVPDLGPGMAQSSSATGAREQIAPVRRAIVGEDPLDLDATTCEERRRALDEGDRIVAGERRPELTKRPAGWPCRWPRAGAANRLLGGCCGA